MLEECPLCYTAVPSWHCSENPDCNAAHSRLMSVVGSWRTISFLVHGIPGTCQRACACLSQAVLVLLADSLTQHLWSSCLHESICYWWLRDSTKSGCPSDFLWPPRKISNPLTSHCFPHPDSLLLRTPMPRLFLCGHYKFLCHLPYLKILNKMWIFFF